MCELPEEEGVNEAAVLQTAVMVSALATAAELVQGFRERRKGHDPSFQEETPYVLGRMEEVLPELHELLFQLLVLVTRSAQPDERSDSHLVRQIDALLVTQRVVRVFHVIHQRLLSLYPRVSETLIEEVRYLESRFSDFDGMDPDDSVRLVERALQITHRTVAELELTDPD